MDAAEDTKDDTDTKKKPQSNTGKALAPSQNAKSALEAYGAYHGEDAGRGLENQTSDDVSVPFLVMLQPGSPLVQEEDTKARPGMWLNTATGEFYSGKDGVTFVPAITQHKMVEWVPRDLGGGIVDQHEIDSDIAKRCRATQPLGAYKHPDLWRPGMSEDELKKINDIVETFYVYGIFIDPQGAEAPAVVAFSSTHIKPYRDWMFRVRSLVIPLGDGRKLTSRDLPLWAVAWQLRSDKREKNANTWYVPAVGFAGSNAVESLVPPGSPLYDAAKSVYEAVSSGQRTADTSGLEKAGRGAVDETPKAGDKGAVEAPY